jgi:nitrile hydratase accessory protein
MTTPHPACDLPGLPQDDARPVFRGLFTWSEWAMALSQAIARAQAAGDPDLGDTYYRHWLDALETLLQAKGLARAETLHALEHAWADAAERTPHGQPMELLPHERALARS